MTDWLDDAHESIFNAIVNADADAYDRGVGLEANRRMARVLRNAISYVSWLEFMLEVEEKPRSRLRAVWELEEDTIELLESEDKKVMSDDAKELLG